VRVSAPAGARLAVPEDAALVFFRVEEGRLSRTATGPGGTTQMPLSKGMGGVIATGGPVTYDLAAGADAPVVFLELDAMAPVEPSPSSSSPE
jgi:hypothetical protein